MDFCCCVGGRRRSAYKLPEKASGSAPSPDTVRKQSLAEKFFEERDRNDSVDSQVAAGRSNSFDMHISNIEGRSTFRDSGTSALDGKIGIRESRASGLSNRSSLDSGGVLKVETRDTNTSKISSVSNTTSVLTVSSGTGESDGNSPTSDNSFETNIFQQALERDYQSLRGSCPPSMGLHLRDVTKAKSLAPVEDRAARTNEDLPSSPVRGEGVQETTELKIDHDDIGYKHLNQYIIIKSLGKGTFGKVKLVLNTLDNKLYAIKVVNKRLLANKIRGKGKLAKEQGCAQMIAKEVAIMKKLDHPNTVNLHEVIEDPNSHKIYLILEYVAGGPIKEKRDRTPIAESVTRLYTRDILKGLSYLHFNKIVHRDLKPENLLKHADGSIKIADFGVANFFEHDSESQSIAGTPAFIAPEIISKSRHDPTSSDIWSLGVCLYNMVFGVLPFTGPTVMEIYARITECDLTFPPTPEVSDDIKDLLVKILVKDPSKRLSLSEFRKHPWVTLDGQLPLILSDTQLQQVDITENEILAAITSNTLISIFSPALTTKVFEPGQYLMRQGEVGSDMFFIDNGEVEILITEQDSQANSFTASYDEGTFDQSFNSKESKSYSLGSQSSSGSSDGTSSTVSTSVVAVRGAGHFIGEMALFQSGTQRKRTASVRAKTVVTALVVTKAQADEIVDNEPLVREKIQSEILKRTSENLLFKTRRRLSGEASETPGTPRKSKISGLQKDEEKGSVTVASHETATMDSVPSIEDTLQKDD